MGTIDSFDPAALDRFIDELIEAGFEAVPGSEGKGWVGPVADCLRQFTEAEEMTIHIRDGWPFNSPRVTVAELEIPHTGHDIVCLWRPDDISLEWMTLSGVMGRIEQFCERAARGFDEQDEMLDAWLAFENSDLTMATFDLTELKPNGFTDGQFEECRGELQHDYLLAVTPGKPSGDDLRGRWYYRADIAVPPPNLPALKDHLTRAQLKNLERGLERLLAGQSGGIDFALLVSKRESGQIEAVAIRFTVVEGALSSSAMQPAPVDEETLILRAGPDAKVLSNKAVVLFGVGALGGHVALLLSESGMGEISLVDGDRLRPSNVVRHVVGSHAVGYSKPVAVSFEIERHAPWTEVHVIRESPFAPTRIRSLVESADLAVDCTGNASVAEAIGRVCFQEEVPFISSALYRKGTVGRIRRQLAGDVPIPDRASGDLFPVIPPSEDDYVGLEIGCSTPVVNAPPVSCALVGALVARESIAVLTTETGPRSEHIYVLRADESLDAPFDEPGVHSFPA